MQFYRTCCRCCDCCADFRVARRECCQCDCLRNMCGKRYMGCSPCGCHCSCIDMPCCCEPCCCCCEEEQLRMDGDLVPFSACLGPDGIEGSGLGQQNAGMGVQDIRVFHNRFLPF